MKTFLFVSMCFCFILVKQEGLCQLCGTSGTMPPPSWVTGGTGARIQSAECLSAFKFNVFTHIVRSTSGQGLSNSVNSTIINRLNTEFRTSAFQFSLLGSDFIDDDKYYIGLSNEQEEKDLLKQNVKDSAINIYVLAPATQWNFAGVADSIPSSSFIIAAAYYNDNVLIHEMGHCLGLYHTFHNTYDYEHSPDWCKELVNGTNGDTCGDYIRDTPADPGGQIWNGCTYIGTATDDNGESYSPSPNNYMAYTFECRNSFTPLQQS